FSSMRLSCHSLPQLGALDPLRVAPDSHLPVFMGKPGIAERVEIHHLVYLALGEPCLLPYFVPVAFAKLQIRSPVRPASCKPVPEEDRVELALQNHHLLQLAVEPAVLKLEEYGRVRQVLASVVKDPVC